VSVQPPSRRSIDPSPSQRVLQIAGLLVRKLASSLLARAAISLGLLAFVLWRIDFEEVRDRFSGWQWGWFAAAVLALLASFTVAALRWHIYLRAAGVALAWQSSLRAYLVGVFATNLLPSQFGGDVARTWLGSRPGGRVRAATTVALDRVTALLCLLVISWMFLLFDADEIPGKLAAALALSSGAALALVAAGTIAATNPGSRLLPARRRAWWGEVAIVLRACVRAPAVFWSTLGLGFVYELFVILALWFVAHGIGLPVKLSVLVVTAPPVLLLSALPVSIAGLGVREGAYALLLRTVDVGTSDAVLFSLLITTAFALATLPGAVAWRDPRRCPLADDEGVSYGRSQGVDP
jgi:uncharacterized membrane protein YbhN (UPF0104 family)